MNLLKLLFIVPILFSCGSLSKKDCETMDWHLKGIQDVQKNRKWMSMLGSYKQKCNEHGTSVDEDRYIEGVKHQGVIKCSGLSNFHVLGWRGVGNKDALNGSEMKSYYATCSPYRIKASESLYKAGYTNGLTNFCTKKSGYDFGFKGGKYIGTCSRTNERSFLAGYEEGEGYYKLNSLEDNLRAAKGKYRSIIDQIESKRDELLDTRRKRDHFVIEKEGYLRGLEENLYELERSRSKLRPVGSTTSNSDSRVLDLRRKLLSHRDDFAKKKKDYIEDIADIENEINTLKRSARDTQDEINDINIEINRAKESIPRQA